MRMHKTPYGCANDCALSDLLPQITALQQQLCESKERETALDIDNDRAWEARDRILAERNALIRELDKGPLSSDEWVLRAINAEHERDAANAALAIARDEITKLRNEQNSLHGGESQRDISILCGRVDGLQMALNALDNLPYPAAALGERDRAGPGDSQAW